MGNGGYHRPLRRPAPHLNRKGLTRTPDPEPAAAPPPAPAQALLSYVTELLEKGFPLPSITAQGSSLTLQVFAPVQAEDTISLAGRVVAKGQQRRSQLGRVPD